MCFEPSVLTPEPQTLLWIESAASGTTGCHNTCTMDHCDSRSIHLVTACLFAIHQPDLTWATIFTPDAIPAIRAIPDWMWCCVPLRPSVILTRNVYDSQSSLIDKGSSS